MSRGERIHAGAKCEREGWDIGTVLVSDDWKEPRRIEVVNKILNASIGLRGLNGRRMEMVVTFPKDVRKAE